VLEVTKCNLKERTNTVSLQTGSYLTVGPSNFPSDSLELHTIPVTNRNIPMPYLVSNPTRKSILSICLQDVHLSNSLL
jgi:hypothetical protein